MMLSFYHTSRRLRVKVNQLLQRAQRGGIHGRHRRKRRGHARLNVEHPFRYFDRDRSSALRSAAENARATADEGARYHDLPIAPWMPTITNDTYINTMGFRFCGCTTTIAGKERWRNVPTLN